MANNYTRKWVLLQADPTLKRAAVWRVMGHSETPTGIRSDNGSEFLCAALVNWLRGARSKSIPAAAASPWENRYIESFHSRLRDTFLESVDFYTVADAQSKRNWFRREYSAFWPHSSLGYAARKNSAPSVTSRDPTHA